MTPDHCTPLGVFFVSAPVPSDPNKLVVLEMSDGAPTNSNPLVVISSRRGSEATRGSSGLACARFGWLPFVSSFANHFFGTTTPTLLVSCLHTYRQPFSLSDGHYASNFRQSWRVLVQTMCCLTLQGRKKKAEVCHPVWPQWAVLWSI